MLTRRANPHYKILNYSQLPGNRDAKYLGHTLNSYKRYNQPMTKPLSVIQRDRLNTHHSGAYEDVEDFHEGAVGSGDIESTDNYSEEVEKRKKERLRNRKETLFKRIKSGVYSTEDNVPRWTPTREAVLWYESKYGDRYYRWRVYFKPETIQSDDVQCVVGMKLMDNTRRGNRPYHNYLHVPHNISGVEGYTDMQMSVVYISRQDGKLCNDTYLMYCEETKLLFPEQLKHTSLKNDVAWSEQNIMNVLKSRYDHDLCLFDAFRRKKEFVWFVPNTDWDNEQSMHVFTPPQKSTYKRPKGISTWRKRRSMSLRRTR